MNTFYSLAYRVGFTPWERVGDNGAGDLDHLLAEEADARAGRLGRALDIGCGSGAHTIALARRGWDATGVDLVPRALDRARQRPGAASATFAVADATDLTAVLRPTFDLFLDVGCFHGLDESGRAAYGRGVTALASPAATLLLLAFDHGAPRPMPRGVSTPEVRDAFPGWEVLAEVPAGSRPPGPMRRVPVRWLRLRRVAPRA